MRQYLVRYLRSIGVSAAAFGLAVCAPLAVAQPLAHQPEPRFRDAPAGDASVIGAPAATDTQALLEADLDAASAEFSNIRKALDILGPLPDHPGLFIPAAPDVSHLYAPAPRLDGASSLFRRAGPDAFATRLTAAPLDSAAEVEALCVELSALAGPCRPVAPIRAW